MTQDVGFTELAKFNIELDKRMGNKCCICHTQNDLAVALSKPITEKRQKA